jgi:hypothetical protein
VGGLDLLPERRQVVPREEDTRMGIADDVRLDVRHGDGVHSGFELPGLVARLRLVVVRRSWAQAGQEHGVAPRGIGLKDGSLGKAVILAVADLRITKVGRPPPDLEASW